MFTHFYKESIRKMVIGFGSLFNDIRVVRKNADGTEKEQIRLPLAYGPKEKFLRRIRETSSLSDDNKVIEVPRLSFEITNYVYDISTDESTFTVNSRFFVNPYNIKYTLNQIKIKFI